LQSALRFRKMKCSFASCGNNTISYILFFVIASQLFHLTLFATMASPPFVWQSLVLLTVLCISGQNNALFSWNRQLKTWKRFHCSFLCNFIFQIWVGFYLRKARPTTVDLRSVPRGRRIHRASHKYLFGKSQITLLVCALNSSNRPIRISLLNVCQVDLDVRLVCPWFSTYFFSHNFYKKRRLCFIPKLPNPVKQKNESQFLVALFS